jgi:hypothetical protein
MSVTVCDSRKRVQVFTRYTSTLILACILQKNVGHDQNMENRIIAEKLKNWSDVSRLLPVKINFKIKQM